MVDGAVSSHSTSRVATIAPYSEAEASIASTCALELAPMAAVAMYRYHDGLDEANGLDCHDETNGCVTATQDTVSCVAMYRSSG